VRVFLRHLYKTSQSAEKYPSMFFKGQINDDDDDDDENDCRTDMVEWSS